MMLRGFIIATFIVAPAIGFAQSNPETPKCNYNGSTQELNACAYQEFDVADQALNKQYKRLMSSLPAAEKDRLRAEQRDWVKSRDPICKEETKEEEGGSIWMVEYYGCRTRATKERTKLLKSQKTK